MTESDWFIDVQAHAFRRACPYPNRFATLTELLAIYDRNNIRRGCIQALVGPETYLPQSNDDIIEMAEQYPDRVIAYCNVHPWALRTSLSGQFGELLRYYRDRGVRGFGEFMPNLEFRDPLVQAVFGQVQDVGFPLCFDMGIALNHHYGLYDDPGLPQLEQSLQRFDRLVFQGHGPPFWAEIARLQSPGDRAIYPRYPVNEEGAVPRLMRKYPNLWGDLSAGSGFNALDRDHAYAVRFLNEFQDRLMFGTDICSPAQLEIPLIGLLQKFRAEGQISEDVFRKIAHGNATRLLKL
jgi:predicted TIM-barrel fold metal-dependent hydrolase